MKENEIDEIEKVYNIKFSKSHREFLKILHTTNKKEVIEYTETLNENSKVLFKEKSFFYNWHTDIEDIKNTLKNVQKDLLKAALNDRLWLKSWGVKPKSPKEIENVFNNWYLNSPKLTPIFSHRFVISEPKEKDNLILSIVGTDTIVYGVNMRHYLLNELKEELGLCELIYDKENDEYSRELSFEFLKVFESEFDKLKVNEIPVWKEFLISNGHNDYLKEN